MTHETSDNWGLPDPVAQPGFYDSVPTKRLLAFIVDLVIIVILSALVVPLTLFSGIFFFPFIMAVVSFVYRILTISAASATPGMRLMGIEFRTSKGERFDMGMAVLHTALFTAWGLSFILQVISVALMLTTARKQGLSDMILGSAAINRPSSY